MNHRITGIVVVTFLLGIGFSACGSTAPPPDIEEAVAIAVEATLTAQPPLPPPPEPETPTPYPTYTPLPTYTPFPTPEEVAEVEAAEEVAEEPVEEPSPTSPPPPPATPTPVPAEPVETAVRPKDNATMVFVPAGEFLMGASDADLSRVGAGGPPKLAGGDEQPQHPVDVPAFWIDQTEVTNAQFSNFVNLTGYETVAELEGYGASGGDQIEGATFYHPRGPETGIDDKADHPVVQVSWQDAKTYCEWAGARLPTEAEWEKAAKGVANDRVFPWGNAFQLPEFDVSTVANFCDASCPQEDGGDPNVDDGFVYTAPVGSFSAGASPYGALDMAGNVWEWVENSYLGYPGNTYERQENFDEYFKVVRGGSWDNAAQHLRSTFRQNNEPRLRSDGTGFRCAISAEEFEPAEAEPAPEEAAPAEPEAEEATEPATEPPAEEGAEPAPEEDTDPETGPEEQPPAEQPAESPADEGTEEAPAEPTSEPETEPDSGG